MKTIMYAITVLLMFTSMIFVVLNIAVWDVVLCIAGLAVAIFSQTKYCYD